MHEDNAVMVFDGIEVYVFQLLELLAQSGEFKVMRGKQGERFILAQHLFQNGGGECEAVEGGGAAADFIHQHQAALICLIEDGSGFRHLYHKGRAAGGEVV